MRRAPKRLLLHFVRPITHDHSPFSCGTPVHRDFSVVQGQIVANGLLSQSDGFHANPSRNYETLTENPVRPSLRGNGRPKRGPNSRMRSSPHPRLRRCLVRSGRWRGSSTRRSSGSSSTRKAWTQGRCWVYGEKALKALDVEKGGDDLSAVMAWQLMDSACYGLNRFNDSLGYLDRANRMLGKLAEDGLTAAEDVWPVHHAVLLELANVKTAMRRREEAIRDLRKCLEIKELTFEEECTELGKANRDVVEAYVAVLNFKEAFPFATKVLEIHRSCLGNNFVEVAQDRRLLGVIYSGLEQHEKALEQNQLS